MISPKIQHDDQERVNILKLYNIHGTKAEKEYDYIAKLASSICGTSVSLVSFIDSKSQWFKARVGTELQENTRDLAICSHAINDKRNVAHIPDMTKDIRFKYHPMVTGESNIKFYAGVPILSPEGYALGTICVMDTVPKRINRMQLDALATLGELVCKLLAIRRNELVEKVQNK
jgi:GAF domain-containing protein